MPLLQPVSLALVDVILTILRPIYQAADPTCYLDQGEGGRLWRNIMRAALLGLLFGFCRGYGEGVCRDVLSDGLITFRWVLVRW